MSVADRLKETFERLAAAKFKRADLEAQLELAATPAKKKRLQAAIDAAIAEAGNLHWEYSGLRNRAELASSLVEFYTPNETLEETLERMRRTEELLTPDGGPEFLKRHDGNSLRARLEQSGGDPATVKAIISRNENEDKALAQLNRVTNSLEKHGKWSCNDCFEEGIHPCVHCEHLNKMEAATSIARWLANYLLDNVENNQSTTDAVISAATGPEGIKAISRKGLAKALGTRSINTVRSRQKRAAKKRR